MRKLYITFLLSLFVASPSVMAGDHKPAFELNAKQMDVITAGFDAEALAEAFAGGQFNVANVSTGALVSTGPSGSLLVAVAVAQAAGEEVGTETEATTDPGDAPFFRTYNLSMNNQGRMVSHSASLEITFIPPSTD